MKALVILLLAAAATAAAGVKTFVGLDNPNTSWDRNANWEPAGQPTLEDTVYIAFSPYVVVSGTNCQAHTVVIQNGGRLVIRKSDNGKKLTVAHDFIVEEGGTFNTAGSPGTNGPVVYIGGDATNAGTWDLTGVSTGNAGVVFNGPGTQHIYGPNPITFQNLANVPNDSLIISVAHVGVMGTTQPIDGIAVTLEQGATFNLGGPPLPITLAWLEAVQAGAGVRVSWRTLSEIDNYGFTVERSEGADGPFQAVGFVPSSGTGAAPRDYAFDDAGVMPGIWRYRLRQTDLSGGETLSEPVTVTVHTLTSAAAEPVPVAAALEQNYPNPFNPETVIRFTLPEGGTAELAVFAVTGERVATLLNGHVEAGREYAVRFSGADLPSGTYIYRLRAGSTVEVRRMLLVR